MAREREGGHRVVEKVGVGGTEKVRKAMTEEEEERDEEGGGEMRKEGGEMRKDGGGELRKRERSMLRFWLTGGILDENALLS